ncbi:MAG TPA: hypothetical protein VJS92_10040, partial [Candidatus Polarisedimenticolaceae bacterium]|nr:hypothetical protein [Candidatus Polarisedimenticolaceae bacterium]
AARATLERQAREGERYFCQATEIKRASSELHPWDPRQYVRDVRSGNVGLLEALTVGAVSLFNAFQRWRGGLTYPLIEGRMTARAPRVVLDLKPGERVQVRSRDEILATLDGRQRNRGLWFDAEMVKYCGRTFRVKQRVERIIDEPTGRLRVLPNDCIILEGVTNLGDYHRFYPQDEYLFWREAWLKRVD